MTSLPRTADGMSHAVEAKNINGLVPWYLMASVLYYHMGVSLLTDARFDEIAQKLKANWDKIEHEHKHFITKDDLDAGTLLLSLENYPLRTRAAAIAVTNGIVELSDEQRNTLVCTPFVPPDRLKDSPLYIHGMGLTWAQHRAVAEKEISERLERIAALKNRSVAPVEAPEAPEVRVRTRARPAPAPVAETPVPEVRVRTRTRAA